MEKITNITQLDEASRYSMYNVPVCIDSLNESVNERIEELENESQEYEQSLSNICNFSYDMDKQIDNLNELLESLEEMDNMSHEIDNLEKVISELVKLSSDLYM